MLPVGALFLFLRGLDEAKTSEDSRPEQGSKAEICVIVLAVHTQAWLTVNPGSHISWAPTLLPTITTGSSHFPHATSACARKELPSDSFLFLPS